MSFLKLAPWTVKHAVAHELNTLGEQETPLHFQFLGVTFLPGVRLFFFFFLFCRLLVGYCKHLY